MAFPTRALSNRLAHPPCPQALLCVAVMALCPRPVGWTLLRLLRELVLLGTTAWQLNLPGSFALQLAASACQVSAARHGIATGQNLGSGRCPCCPA